MLPGFIVAGLAAFPHPVYLVLMFFVYSFCGYILECIVLSIEKKRMVIDRGFASHLPFCIIYGFGALAGFVLLNPLENNLLLLFVVGAIVASGFEYLTAQIQTRIFGDFWWDYTQKPLNYKGILCLESTLGWGVVALLVVKVMHHTLAAFVQLIPFMAAVPIAVLLLAAYATDFFISARLARRTQNDCKRQAPEAETPLVAEWTKGESGSSSII